MCDQVVFAVCVEQRNVTTAAPDVARASKPAKTSRAMCVSFMRIATHSAAANVAMECSTGDIWTLISVGVCEGARKMRKDLRRWLKYIARTKSTNLKLHQWSVVTVLVTWYPTILVMALVRE